MSFIRSLECTAFPGITNRLERDIQRQIQDCGTMPTQGGWAILQSLQTRLSNIQKLVIEYNSLTEVIAKKERAISHSALLYPEVTISSDGLKQNQERLKVVSAKLSVFYQGEMNLTQVDLDFHLKKMNAHIWTLEQNYPRPSQDTIDLIDELKQKRQSMRDELQFVNQKLRKD